MFLATPIQRKVYQLLLYLIYPKITEPEKKQLKVEVLTNLKEFRKEVGF